MPNRIETSRERMLFETSSTRLALSLKIAPLVRLGVALRVGRQVRFALASVHTLQELDNRRVNLLGGLLCGPVSYIRQLSTDY